MKGHLAQPLRFRHKESEVKENEAVLSMNTEVVNITARIRIQNVRSTLDNGLKFSDSSFHRLILAFN